MRDARETDHAFMTAKKSSPPFRTATRSCWSTRSWSGRTRGSSAPRLFRGEEWFFAGHYPGFPLVPGVLLCEAAMQCGAILLSISFREKVSGTFCQRPCCDKVPDIKSPRGHAHERRPLQADGSPRRYDRHGSGTDRAAGRRLLPQGQGQVDGKVAVRFEFACTAATSEQPPE